MYQLCDSLSKALWVECTAIDGDLDPLLVDDIYGLAKSLPRCLFIAWMLSKLVGFGIVCYIGLCS